MKLKIYLLFVVIVLCCFVNAAALVAKEWQIGEPITTYWGGPLLSDPFMDQLKSGHFNLAFAYGEKDLQIAQKNGVRAMLYEPDLLNAQTMNDPEKLAKLDEMVARVKSLSTLYFYFIVDEPSASQFPALAKLVAHLKKLDPAHPAYINLLPTYASNEQLGTKGDVTTAYREHLRLFVEQIKPAMLSYDHYHFYIDPSTGRKSDGQQYFLNLALMREAALKAGVPFMNIVQGSSWEAGIRIPTPAEISWLNYTSLAYGAQAIMYFVFSNTFQYESMKVMNPQFISIATQLQPLNSIGAYHLGNVPSGAAVMPKNAPFTLEFTAKDDSILPSEGMLLGYFGKKGNSSEPTHVLVVNLSYKRSVSTTLVAPQSLSLFDAATGKWKNTSSRHHTISLPPGGGKLVRIKQ